MNRYFHEFGLDQQLHELVNLQLVNSQIIEEESLKNFNGSLVV